MATDPKILELQTLLGNDAEATTDLLTVYLAVAKEKILNRMYPFGVPSTVVDVPSKYYYKQLQLAQRYFLRRGAEGEVGHNENGVNRTYESSDDEEILRDVIQVAKVV